DLVAVDKTGTLTEGRPRVTDIVVLDPGLDADGVLLLAARAEAGSEHPLARPILQQAAESGLPISGLPERTEPIPGRGIVATVDGEEIAVGTLALIETRGAAGAELASAAEVAANLAEAGRTPMVVARAGRPIGVIAVADRTRADAAEMIRHVHGTGVTRVVMLTGDLAPVGQAVARELGID